MSKNDLALDKRLQLVFNKSKSDITKMLDNLANERRLCIVEISGNEYFIYVEKVNK